jgi:hypothetical protein
MRKPAILLVTCLALAACGKEQTLHPPAGASLPPKPANAPTTPTSADLLKQSAQMLPSRSDELLTKSQPRPDDPFDLPPPK